MNISNIENLNSLKNKIDLTRLWNSVLNKSIEPSKKFEPSSYINLDNYVFRLESLLFNSNQSSNNNSNNSNFTKLIGTCEEYVKKNSELKDYLASERERANLSFKKNTKDTSIVECIDIDVSDSAKNNSISDENQPKIDNNDNSSKLIDVKQDKKDESVSNSNSEDMTVKLIEILNIFKIDLKQENKENLKNLIINLSNKFNQNLLKQFCINLQDIDNYHGTLNNENTSKICSLKENEVNLILNIIIDMNANDNVLSYNSSYLFLRFILSDYVTLNLKQSTSNTNLILSRKIYSLCCTLCKQISNQFIFSCLVNWLMFINETTLSNDSHFKSTNKIFTEFLIKLIKECFGERESITMLENLLLEHSPIGLKWSENVYSVLACLIEKISNLGMENLNSLINRIQHDSNELSKSVIFSKFLLLILNKYKTSFSSKNEDIYSDRNNISNYINQNLNQLVEKLSIIIQNNQTIMKKTLQTMLNSFSKI
jgi:hypothetical protein